jgi:hypothetical protein
MVVPIFTSEWGLRCAAPRYLKYLGGQLIFPIAFWQVTHVFGALIFITHNVISLRINPENERSQTCSRQQREKEFLDGHR